MQRIFACPMPRLDAGQLWELCCHYERILPGGKPSAQPLNSSALHIRLGRCLGWLILREHAITINLDYCFSYSSQLVICLLNDSPQKTAVDVEIARNIDRQAICGFLARMSVQKKSCGSLKFWTLYECLIKLAGPMQVEWIKAVLGSADSAKTGGNYEGRPSCVWRWLPFLGHWICLCKYGTDLRFELEIVKWQDYL